MAHFYGSIRGAHGEATRLGSKASGLATKAASWEGAVSVRLYFDETNDCDACEVSLVPHEGRGVSRVLYCGPVGEYAPHVAAQ